MCNCKSIRRAFPEVYHSKFLKNATDFPAFVDAKRALAQFPESNLSVSEVLRRNLIETCNLQNFVQDHSSSRFRGTETQVWVLEKCLEAK